MVIDWTQVICAFVLAIPPTVLALINSTKIDENTKLTKDGAKAASTSADLAKDAALEADRKADKLATQLNGVLEGKITGIVNDALVPIHESMAEIRLSLAELKGKEGS